MKLFQLRADNDGTIRIGVFIVLVIFLVIVLRGIKFRSRADFSYDRFVVSAAFVQLFFVIIRFFFLFRGMIKNGTAVLGLGDIGPEAGKPVMEGKGVLFKIFADIDVFDIEINEKDQEKFVQIVKALEPTFGGINLEDIKAPECFYIEKRLKEEMKIPVMHDDQHGTAIISAAALLNAIDIQKKKIEKAKFVVNGAGAAAMACILLYE